MAWQHFAGARHRPQRLWPKGKYSRLSRFDPTSPDQNLSREGIYLIFGDVFSAGFDVVVIVVLLLWIRI
jgi:hypothetical protein